MLITHIGIPHIPNRENPLLLVEKEITLSTGSLVNILQKSNSDEVYLCMFGQKMDLSDFKNFFGLCHGTHDWNGREKLKYVPSIFNHFDIAANFNISTKSGILLYDFFHDDSRPNEDADIEVCPLLNKKYGYLSINNLSTSYPSYPIQDIVIYPTIKNFLRCSKVDWTMPRTGKTMKSRFNSILSLYKAMKKTRREDSSFFKKAMSQIRVEFSWYLSNPFELSVAFSPSIYHPERISKVIGKIKTKNSLSPF